MSRCFARFRIVKKNFVTKNLKMIICRLIQYDSIIVLHGYIFQKMFWFGYSKIARLFLILNREIVSSTQRFWFDTMILNFDLLIVSDYFRLDFEIIFWSSFWRVPPRFLLWWLLFHVLLRSFGYQMMVHNLRSKLLHSCTCIFMFSSEKVSLTQEIIFWFEIASDSLSSCFLRRFLI